MQRQTPKVPWTSAATYCLELWGLGHILQNTHISLQGLPVPAHQTIGMETRYLVPAGLLSSSKAKDVYSVGPAFWDRQPDIEQLIGKWSGIWAQFCQFAKHNATNVPPIVCFTLQSVNGSPFPRPKVGCMQAAAKCQFAKPNVPKGHLNCAILGLYQSTFRVYLDVFRE